MKLLVKCMNNYDIFQKQPAWLQVGVSEQWEVRPDQMMLMTSESLAWHIRGYLVDEVIWLVFLSPVSGGQVDIVAKVMVLCWEWVRG